jgi:prevent-host-death family protein
MKTASVTEIESRFNSYVPSSKSEPVVVTRNGRPVAVIFAVQDQDDVERLLMATSTRLQAVISESRKQIRAGDALSHEDFWAQVKASRDARRHRQKRKATIR